MLDPRVDGCGPVFEDSLSRRSKFHSFYGPGGGHGISDRSQTRRCFPKERRITEITKLKHYFLRFPDFFCFSCSCIFYHQWTSACAHHHQILPWPSCVPPEGSCELCQGPVKPDLATNVVATFTLHPPKAEQCHQGSSPTFFLRQQQRIP